MVACGKRSSLLQKSVFDTKKCFVKLDLEISNKNVDIGICQILKISGKTNTSKLVQFVNIENNIVKYKTP